MYADHTGNTLQRLLLHQYSSRSGSEKIKVLRTDNGGEYLSNDFKKYLSDLEHPAPADRRVYSAEEWGDRAHEPHAHEPCALDASPATAVYVRNRVTSQGFLST